MTKVKIGRGEFKAYICTVVDHCDDESFQGLSELFLTACGVIDQEGNLTEEYANSPYWSFENGEMKPREFAVKMGEMIGGDDGVRTERDQEGA